MTDPNRPWPWLAETSLVVSASLLVVCAVVVALGRHCEPAFRYSSGVLQLVGILAVAVDIRGKRLHTGRPTARARLGEWWERGPWGRRTATGNTAGASSLKVRVQPATATGLMDPSASPPERLIALERGQEALRNDFGAFKGATNTALAEVNKRIGEETTARELEDRASKAWFEEGLAGDLDLAVAGAVFLTVGLALATFASNYGKACWTW